MNPCENCRHYVPGIGACMVWGYDLGRHLDPNTDDPCGSFEPVPAPEGEVEP